MEGSVLGFNQDEGKGTIKGEDGKRYAFSKSDWSGDIQPMPGQKVDFDVDGDDAKGIFPVTSTRETKEVRTKSKPLAGVLAIYLGGLGVHKFYLGQWGWGIVYLAAFILTLGILGIVTSILGSV